MKRSIRSFAIEEKVARIDPREAKKNVAALEQEKQSKTEKPVNNNDSTKESGQPDNDVQIDLSKSAEVTFNPPRINQSAKLSEQEINSLSTENIFDFKKVSKVAFNKRASEPEHNWQAHQEKFGDKDLSQAWNVFMQDAWGIHSEIAPMINSELANTWEKDYYDFFYEGGKEAYDSSINNGTELNYSSEAIQHFENLYDSQIAKTMQENLANEVIGKHSPAQGNEPIAEIPTDQVLPHEMSGPVADLQGTNKEVKAAASKPNKFEQRKAAAVEKNRMIEKNLANSPEQRVANDSPTMK